MPWPTVANHATAEVGGEHDRTGAYERGNTGVPDAGCAVGHDRDLAEK